MAEPSALYRRYRPETFADVIGQEHVTEPLSQALSNSRTNHAYLFSGPRGCGKTTSARILARCLNCAQGPTPTPCGVCASCTDLARGGGGSLDVVEIDAASHGGVDDARELRERAAMAPARDRYKVYIIDEAHMVSPQGFNALLKLVEEPPEHVTFVFATTEPDKVLPTIRSRTHHYPFHLVPPHVLTGYLAELCEREKVPVGKGVLPMVVRAGGGSVRDSLSVLDQLMAGSDADGVDYTRAAALLGYTDSTLLDDVVGAVDAADGATLFTVVDRVIESGHDPRRFVEDLLERLRDLIVVQALGDRAGGVLRGLPPDQLERMAVQSSTLGAASLSRAADIVSTALTDMVGASSPRMHLELLCARLLLPAADAGTRGLGARMDRIERRLGVPVTEGQAGLPGAAVSGVPGPPRSVESPPDDPQSAAAPVVGAPSADPAGTGQLTGVRSANVAEAGVPPVDRQDKQRPASRTGQDAAPVALASAPTQRREAEGAEQTSRGHAQQPARAMPSPGDPDRPMDGAPHVEEPGTAVGAVDTAAVRRVWTEVLSTVGKASRVTWAMLADVHVHEYADGILRLAFANPGAARAFSGGRHPAVVSRALAEVLGLEARVEAVATEAAPSPPITSEAAPVPPVASHATPPTAATPSRAQSPEPVPSTRSAAAERPAGRPPVASSEATPRDPRPDATAPATGTSPDQTSDDQTSPKMTSPDQTSADPTSPTTTSPTTTSPTTTSPKATSPKATSPKRTSPEQTVPGTGRLQARQMERAAARSAVAPEDDVAAPDDQDADDSGMVGRPVVEQMLGGRVIDVEDQHG